MAKIRLKMVSEITFCEKLTYEDSNTSIIALDVINCSANRIYGLIEPSASTRKPNG